MKSSTKYMLIAMVFTVAISIAYYIGMTQHHCPPAIVVETFCYDLTPGKNGIIRFNVDTDSLAHVIYVQDKDTFALDYISRAEFDSLVTVLYPEQ